MPKCLGWLPAAPSTKLSFSVFTEKKEKHQLGKQPSSPGWLASISFSKATESPVLLLAFLLKKKAQADSHILLTSVLCEAFVPKIKFWLLWTTTCQVQPCMAASLSADNPAGGSVRTSPPHS